MLFCQLGQLDKNTAAYICFLMCYSNFKQKYLVLEYPKVRCTITFEEKENQFFEH